jgi:hypothetical protein
MKPGAFPDQYGTPDGESGAVDLYERVRMIDRLVDGRMVIGGASDCRERELSPSGVTFDDLGVDRAVVRWHTVGCPPVPEFANLPGKSPVYRDDRLYQFPGRPQAPTQERLDGFGSELSPDV